MFIATDLDYIINNFLDFHASVLIYSKIENAKIAFFYLCNDENNIGD